MQIAQFSSPLPQSSVLIGDANGWLPVVQELIAQVHPADMWQPQDMAKSLPMAEIAAIQQFASRTPFAPSGKLLILPDVTTWSLETANALLKLIEEPPEYLTIVAFAQSSQFLPTVRSRLTQLFLSVRYATVEGADSTITDRERWRAFFKTCRLQNEEQRQFARDALYLQSIVHSGHRQSVIIEALQEAKRYL